MQYRKFGKLDYRASALGFGCMRLPTKGSSSQIDEPEAIRMIRHAIDQGVNYVDTAYGYHGGNSERVVGRALQDGYRAKVKLATKLPVWQVKEAADFDRILNEQLAKLQTTHIDMYLLHSLEQKTWRNVHKLGVLRWAEGAIADGRIGCLGFSFHDVYDVFQEIVDAYDKWAFCQIQYNYMDIETQAGLKGLKYAASKGLAVVVMEPLLGGKLAAPPPQVQAALNKAKTKRTPADWALQWLWDQPEVSLVLSGMSTMEQVEQNLASAAASGAKFTATEHKMIAQAREAYRASCPIPCTGCRYCMPCPNGVEIPYNFEIYNNGAMFDSLSDAREEYAGVAEGERASACIQCRLCEDLCPQHILISEWMPTVDEVLGQGKPYPKS